MKFLGVGNKRKSHLDANYRVSHQFTSSNLDFFIGSSTKPRKGSNDGIVYLNQGDIMWELNLSTKNSPCQSMPAHFFGKAKKRVDRWTRCWNLLLFQEASGMILQLLLG